MRLIFKFLKDLRKTLLINNNKNLRNSIYIINVFLFFEFLMLSLIESYAVKLLCIFIFSIPQIAFLIECEEAFTLDAYFEICFCITFKIFLIFSKSLNFFELIITIIIINLFDIYYQKKYYINKFDLNQYIISNKKYRKINTFELNFKFLLFGFLLSSIWFLYIANKLNFYFFDEGKINKIS